MRRFSKLNEFDLEANGSTTKKVSFDGKESNNGKNELEDINETFQEMNLTDQLLLGSEKHLEIGKANLLDAEVSNFSSSKAKERLKAAKNQGDSALSIELKNFDFSSSGKSNFVAKLNESTRIENVDNIEEEIVIKEPKGPVLFKIDNHELEYIRVWRTIKFGILSICVLAGFLFYVSLPLIISFSKIN